MKNKISAFVVSFLLLASCASGQKKNEFALQNTFHHEMVSDDVITICAKNMLDRDSYKMIPIKGFDRENFDNKLEANQIDTSMDAIQYPVDNFLSSFFDFGSNCDGSESIELEKVRTYVDYTGYGKGAYGIAYKIEASVGTVLGQRFYSSFAETKKIAMFTSKQKRIQYQSEALTSAFLLLYQKIFKDFN